MACIIEVKDIVKELGKSGVITAAPGLSIDQTTGVLAGITKGVDQGSEDISLKGLGPYGLRLEDLQLTELTGCSIVKKGFAVSTDPADFALILSDPSVFTGKNGVDNVDKLLGNEGLQQQLSNEIIKKKMCDLRLQGIITGNETAAELAGIAGMAATFSVADIKAKLLGNVSGLLGSAMDEIASIAALGSLLAVTKSGAILSKITGIGKAAISLPDLSILTIDTADVDAAAAALVGSLRIQPPAEINELAAIASQAARLGPEAIAAALVAKATNLPSLSPGDYDDACTGDL